MAEENKGTGGQASAGPEAEPRPYELKQCVTGFFYLIIKLIIVIFYWITQSKYARIKSSER